MEWYHIDAASLMTEHGLDQEHALLNCDFTAYAPKVFASILTNFFKPIDFAHSLDIVANADKIRQIAESSEGQGGKSGEFFFLTHDRRLILKSTNEKEASKIHFLLI